MLVDTKNDVINKVCKKITDYLLSVQDFSPGEYYGSFWSEKAYHGPLLDYNAGGAHHHRAAAARLWHYGLLAKKITTPR